MKNILFNLLSADITNPSYLYALAFTFYIVTIVKSKIINFFNKQKVIKQECGKIGLSSEELKQLIIFNKEVLKSLKITVKSI